MKILTFLSVLLFGTLFAEDVPTTVGDFTFKAGEGWAQSPVTPMVKAAVSQGENGPVLKFYHFGKGQGGGVEVNLKRWKGQFEGDPKMIEEEITKAKEDFVKLLKSAFSKSFRNCINSSFISNLAIDSIILATVN